MQKFINFLLYSNLFIAACAVAMTLQTFYILDISWKTSPELLGLVFFSTQIIYALHRLISLSKIDKSLNVNRFEIIKSYQSHIQIYTVISFLGAGICFLFLNKTTQFALVLPAFLSLGYVIPFLGKRKLRLRDINFIKIFLIAIVWAYVTVLLPLLELGLEWKDMYNVMILERIIFIFVITLPFDMRDWEIDKLNGVRTIPAVLGIQKTVYLAMFLLLIWIGIVGIIYNFNIALPLAISGLVVGILIYKAPQQTEDYYFTALMDGTMLLQYFLLILNFEL